MSSKNSYSMKIHLWTIIWNCNKSYFEVQHCSMVVCSPIFGKNILEAHCGMGYILEMKFYLAFFSFSIYVICKFCSYWISAIFTTNSYRQYRYCWEALNWYCHVAEMFHKYKEKLYIFSKKLKMESIVIGWAGVKADLSLLGNVM